MALLTGQVLAGDRPRTYHVHVPEAPAGPRVPVVVVLHGGGQSATTIARRWGVDPPAPVPAALAGYLLVFPEADPLLGGEWVHLLPGDGSRPDHDLRFLDALLDELTTRPLPTGVADVPTVTGDPAHVYAAGFSNGGAMVWQLATSSLVHRVRGLAVVGRALDPEKVEHFRRELGGAPPPPVPVLYVHGTGDVGFRPPSTTQEVPLRTTLPSFTVREMAARNGVATDEPTVTRLVPGSTNLTEVVVQLFRGTAAFAMATVLHGGHNWPTPTTRGNPPVATHFDATEAVVTFWQEHAGLPTSTGPADAPLPVHAHPPGGSTMSDRPLTSGAPGRRAAVDLTPSPHAQALRARPGKPPGAVQLTGYLGDSTRADRVRLYLDPGLLSWLEVARTDVLHRQDLPASPHASGVSVLWVRRTAPVGPSRTSAADMVGVLLSGELIDRYLPASTAGEVTSGFFSTMWCATVAITWHLCVTPSCEDISIPIYCDDDRDDDEDDDDDGDDGDDTGDPDDTGDDQPETESPTG